MPTLQINDGHLVLVWFKFERSLFHILAILLAPTLSTLRRVRSYLAIRFWTSVLLVACLTSLLGIVVNLVFLNARIVGCDRKAVISAILRLPFSFGESRLLPETADIRESHEHINRLEASVLDLRAACQHTESQAENDFPFHCPAVATADLTQLRMRLDELASSVEGTGALISHHQEAALKRHTETILEIERLRKQLAETAHMREVLSSVVVNIEHTRSLKAQRTGALHSSAIERPDFALYTTGGKTLSDLCSPPRTKPAQSFFSWLSSVTWEAARRQFTGRERGRTEKPWPLGSDMAIHYELNPGYCWAFSGSRGHLGVQLARPVIVEEVAIDHSRSHWDSSQAPRFMELWVLIEGSEAVNKARRWEIDGEHVPPDDVQKLFGKDKYLRVGRFEYDLRAAQASQTFPVDSGFQALSLPVRIVFLLVLDNWGNQEYTCLYRFRVHGRLPDVV
ncbi:hypothetical protein PENSPDRAFT_694837 [Peniophora sp. CONT]|nr:hypothetical protein PENSPDRAFT_694837 [Peniophora sp. CONT]